MTAGVRELAGNIGHKVDMSFDRRNTSTAYALSRTILMRTPVSFTFTCRGTKPPQGFLDGRDKISDYCVTDVMERRCYSKTRTQKTE